jgi:hypothetical protein
LNNGEWKTLHQEERAMSQRSKKMGWGRGPITGSELEQRRAAAARADRVQFILFWFVVCVVAGMMFLTCGLQVWQVYQLERLIQAHDAHHAETEERLEEIQRSMEER